MRGSFYLPHRAAANVTRAREFADALGRSLNTMVSINYGLTDCRPEDMSASFERLRDNYFGPWFRRTLRGPLEPAERGPPTYVWVAEGRPGHHNVHWMVHVPAALRSEFDRRLPEWLAKTAGAPLKGALHVQTARTPAGAIDYMLKGLHPRHAKRFNIDHDYQGEVTGKRCGVSKNLGPTAIKRARVTATVVNLSAA